MMERIKREKMVSRDRERGQVKDEIGRRRMRVTSERRGP